MTGKFTYKHTTKQKALFLSLSFELYKTQQLLLAYKYHSQPLEQLEYSKLQTVNQLLYSSLS